MYTEKYLRDNIIPMMIVSQANQIGIEQRQAMHNAALEFGSISIRNNTRIIQVLHSADICDLTWKIQKVLSDGNCVIEVYDDRKKAELATKGINAISFQIENIDFTNAFEAAVEAKQVATQEKQKAQTEQERLTMEKKQDAERKRIEAEAKADVQKIEADAEAYAVSVKAEAEAKANEEIAKTLSDPLIKYNTVNRWDGKLPTVQSGEGTSNIIDIRSLTTTE